MDPGIGTAGRGRGDRRVGDASKWPHSGRAGRYGRGSGSASQRTALPSYSSPAARRWAANQAATSLGPVAGTRSVGQIVEQAAGFLALRGVALLQHLVQDAAGAIGIAHVHVGPSQIEFGARLPSWWDPRVPGDDRSSRPLVRVLPPLSSPMSKSTWLSSPRSVAQGTVGGSAPRGCSAVSSTMRCSAVSLVVSRAGAHSFPWHCRRREGPACLRPAPCRASRQSSHLPALQEIRCVILGRRRDRKCRRHWLRHGVTVDAGVPIDVLVAILFKSSAPWAPVPSSPAASSSPVRSSPRSSRLISSV